MMTFLGALLLTILAVAALVAAVAWLTHSLWWMIGAATLALLLCLPFFYLFCYLLTPLMWLEDWLRHKCRSQAEKAAMEAFLRLHPKAHVACTHEIDEPERVVVGVFHGPTAPPRCIFFSVDKTTHSATILNDDAKYRPKQWQ